MKKRLTKTQKERILIVQKYLKVGDLITCTRCGGELAEFTFMGRDGHWLIGKATRETMKHNTFVELKTTDIAEIHVTHINRQQVEALPFLEKLNDRK